MSNPRYGKLAGYVAGILLFCWFIFVIRGGLASWFSGDDLMNLNYYRSRPWTSLLKANLCFWSSYYRPGGGLFYRSIYALWGFRPLPFRIAVLWLLSVDFVLLALIARQLTGSRWAALVALLTAGIHPTFSPEDFDTGMIYDVLAYMLPHPRTRGGAGHLRSRMVGRAAASILDEFVRTADGEPDRAFWQAIINRNGCT